MNKHFFGVIRPDNFPLNEVIFSQIVFKLLCNFNISASGAKLILDNEKLWLKASCFFEKLDLEIVDIGTEDNLNQLINELRFLKYTVSDCSCEAVHKVVFKLTSWIDTFGILTPFELKCYSDAIKTDYSKLRETQLNHILSTTTDKDKALKYLSEWWIKMTEFEINVLLDNINQHQKPEPTGVKTGRKI